MKLIKPKKLKKGDVIGLIAPASSVVDEVSLNNGISYFESLGYNVEIGKNVKLQKGYLAGTDEERLADLHEMFSNKNVNAIFAIRGGYGSGRLLDKINYSLIKRNPKIFVGYSDITALQMAILKKTGLVTFTGPMPGVDYENQMNENTEETFWKTITNSKKIGKLSNPTDDKFYILAKGRAEGKIVGGNLSMLLSLAGTEYFPDLKNSIMVLEEIAEAPYRIDRMFNQLRLMKAINNISGLILGRFLNCYEPDSSKPSLTLNEVITDYWQNVKFPVFYNFVHGHVKDSITLPFGLNAKLNTTKCFIEITENAVE